MIVITLSGRLSATYQSAVIAAEQHGGPISVFDSRSVSMGLGLQVLAGARAAEEGADLDAVGQAVRAVADRTHLVAALDTLEFLKRGGRIGGAQALIGNLLDVKPLIAIQDGVVEAAGRVRTRSKAKLSLVAHIRDRAEDIADISVLHGGADDTEAFTAAVGATLPDRSPIIAQLGPVVGTHAGPGTLGVAYTLR